LVNLRRWIVWSIVGTGISSVATQLLTIREFLTQFSGNEITISLVIFCWLMLTGMGAFAATFLRKGGTTTYALLIFIIALWPLIQTIGIREFRETFFIHGASPGFYPILLYILITIAPYCLLTGFILPYSQYILNANRYPFDSGDLYVTDSIGDIAGGVLFSFVLVYWLKPFTVIAVTSSLLILTALLILASRRQRLFLVGAVTVSLGFYTMALNSGLETATLSLQYGSILRYTESPYGRIVITREGPQYTFWESGLPLYSGSNIMDSEEKVHYPLSQINRTDSILLISGGLGQTLQEIAKYHPERIDYVELDPSLTQTAEELGVIPHIPSLSIVNTDARHFLKTTPQIYDAVIMDLPDPDTFQLNRFYTREFFRLVKCRLKEGGILSLNLSYSPNYISSLRKKKLSSLYNTARTTFKHVLLLPGEQAHFLMSDRPLSPDIPARLKSRHIPTSYIEGFFNGNVTDERIRQLKESLDAHEPLNSDMAPRLMNLVFREWFVRHGSHPGYFITALLALTGLYLIFMKRAEYILFSTGFATMGVEMLVIFAFQVIYGYIYLEIGAIITAFLLGLLPGAWIAQHWRIDTGLKLRLSEMALIALLTAFLLWLSFFGAQPPPGCFLGFCFIFSFFAGFQFPAAAEMIGEDSSPAAGCLAADLCGAAVGTLAAGTLLIPLWGIRFAAIVLILVKISSMMLILFTEKRQN